MKSFIYFYFFLQILPLNYNILYTCSSSLDPDQRAPIGFSITLCISVSSFAFLIFETKELAEQNVSKLQQMGYEPNLYQEKLGKKYIERTQHTDTGRARNRGSVMSCLLRSIVLKQVQ